MRSKVVLDRAVEVIPGAFYFCCGEPSWEKVKAACRLQSALCYCVDDELLYEPFFQDFGPLNMGHTYAFCLKTAGLLQKAHTHGLKVYLYAGANPQLQANACVLLGAFQVLFLGRSVMDAFSTVQPVVPDVAFRDASSTANTFPLTALDIIKGLAKAKQAGFLPWCKDPALFDLDFYRHYEQVQNGDLNWVVPGKLLAFAGPTDVAKLFYGYKLLVPEDYHPLFRSIDVTAVVRLNNAMYSAERFAGAGFAHHELFFPDGSCPELGIVDAFLDIVENTSGAVAVHCKAGLGRTGVLICCYMMKHYGFTAEESIAYIRVCRPGSVIGPQQHFLCHMQMEMWRRGCQHQFAPPVVSPADKQQPRALQSPPVLNITADGSWQLPQKPEAPTTPKTPRTAPLSTAAEDVTTPVAAMSPPPRRAGMRLFNSLRDLARSSLDRASSDPPQQQQQQTCERGGPLSRRPPASPKPTKVRHTASSSTPAASRASLAASPAAAGKGAPQVSEAHFTAPNGQPRKGFKAVAPAGEPVPAGGKATEWALPDPEASPQGWSIGSFSRIVAAGR